MFQNGADMTGMDLSRGKIQLSVEEKVFYRDRIREARYDALKIAEGFEGICFALEALGLRLNQKQGDMGRYGDELRSLASESTSLSSFSISHPGLFSTFDALYLAVSAARNDVMHTGAYARSVTQRAVELSIGLEEALMADVKHEFATVADFMVRSPVTVQPWQPVAYARQLMLSHSISYLPIQIDDQWRILSETAVLRFLGVGAKRYDGKQNHDRKERLGSLIKDARPSLELMPAELLLPTTPLDEVLNEHLPTENSTRLWLVLDDIEDPSKQNLLGVFTPFDLL